MVLQEYQHDKHGMLLFSGGGTGELFLGDGGTANLCPQFQPVWFGLLGPLGFSAVSPAAVPLPDAQVFLLTPFPPWTIGVKVESIR